MSESGVKLGFYTQCLSISGAGLGFTGLGYREPCENGYLWSVMAVSTLVLDMAKASENLDLHFC